MKHFGFIIKGMQSNKVWYDAWQVLADSQKDARAVVDKNIAIDKQNGYDRMVKDISDAGECNDDYDLGVEFFDKICKKVEKMNSSIKINKQENN